MQTDSPRYEKVAAALQDMRKYGRIEPKEESLLQAPVGRA
jgi:hypothetical protein